MLPNASQPVATSRVAPQSCCCHRTACKTHDPFGSLAGNQVSGLTRVHSNAYDHAYEHTKGKVCVSINTAEDLMTDKNRQSNTK
jgi:hypothetical protein